MGNKKDILKSFGGLESKRTQGDDKIQVQEVTSQQIEEMLQSEEEGEKITSKNFFRNTKAIFSHLPNKIEEILEKCGEPDFESESGSRYWYFDEGVIRWSDNWGEVVDCTWEPDEALALALSAGKGDDIGTEAKRFAGFCPWDSFEKKEEIS